MRRTTTTPKTASSASATDIKKLLKVSDVADILGVSKVQVYTLLKQGLPSVKFGGARRVHPDKLQVWIEQHSA